MSRAETGDKRARLARALDPELRRAPGLSPLNRAIVALILFSVALGVAETEPAFRARWNAAFWTAEAVLLVLFGLEYAARFWTAPLNPRYRSGWDWAREPSALLDLAVIGLMAAPFLGASGALLRLLRALRLVRLARLGRFSRAIAALGQAVRSRREELWLSFGFAILVLLVSSTLLWLVEGRHQPEAFGSIPRAMWWSVATLTTVGYGDVVPYTGLGRVLAAVTALTGIGLIALPTGVLAAAFSEAMQTTRARGRRR